MTGMEGTYKDQYNSNTQTLVAKGNRSVAIEVMELTESTADMARKIAERLKTKLDPVLVSDCTLNNKTEVAEAKNPRQYPPLFASLNVHIRSIQDSLDSIEDTITRTAL